MPIYWNVNLIILSVLTAMYGSFAALSHADRMRKSTGKAALAWMISGGVTLGLSIWSMHFIGMLAFHLPVPIAYDLTLTFLSVLPAVAAALLGFYLLQSQQMQIGQITIGGFLMGVGISAMHYTGMAALKMQPAITYDPIIFTLSILISILAAVGALMIVYAGEKTNIDALIRHSIGAFIMGLAIAGMHYTGMAASNFAVGSLCTVNGVKVDPTLLSILIAGTVFFLVTGGWIANMLDKRMVKHNEINLVKLGKQTQELEIDRDILEKINSGRSMHKVLNDLAIRVEAQHPKMICTILLLDHNTNKLSLVAAPSMPEACREKLDGLLIGDGVGSCGTAAYTGKQVIIEDVKSHVYWKEFQDLVRLGDFVSCWAQPIKNYENKVFGTFAIYYKKQVQPTKENLALLERYAHLAQLVLERKEHEDEISYIAFHDSLTRLPNRRLLLDRLQQALNTSDRTRRHGAVIFIDLDKFKALNDAKGHDIGDLVLIEMAQRLKANMRKSDTVSRVGGDEFVVMSTDLDEDYSEASYQAELISEKILTILKEPFLVSGCDCQTTASIGISIFNGSELSATNHLKHADAAMYQSKHAGRNRMHFFDPTMQEEIEARLNLEGDLSNAILENQLSLNYQMQVDKENHILGAEALLRWFHPTRGHVSPMNFIPIAEETGFILQIGQFVLETACMQLKKWEKNVKTSHLVLAINVSLFQFKQNNFVHDVKGAVEKFNINPERLKIELTESMVVENVHETIKKMQELREFGVRFSMDDFGTGYSSLASIKHLPITQLKIDKSFVDDIVNNKSDAAIVKTIVAMGNILGLNVIAEGVENAAQLKMLKACDCEMYQGYYFSKPLPIEQFDALVNDWTEKN
jgi:diguanylate cyclase (GGDEF)-like protein